MPVSIRDDMLQNVEKPARYTGGELNIIRKNPGDVDIRFAFCFPDIYEVGMSHLGMRILYGLLNEREDTYCERVFAPWPDMEAEMRRKGIPLFALESRDPVGEFDFMGFTLQYEMSYTNILNMLNLSGVPLLRTERSGRHPLVCAGGPCAYNPEPLADFIDFFVLGEGEDVINEVLDVYKQCKKERVPREEFLNRIIGIEGIYVPGFYSVSYYADGRIKGVEPAKPQYPSRIMKRIVKDPDHAYFPERMIVPYLSVVHDRIMLELFRGCTRGCRFCQAGFVYRPVRERTPAKLLELARRLEESTGYEEISLASLSTSDYPGLPELTSGLINEMEPKKVNLALPSLRIDSFSLDLMEKVQKVRKSGLTFAPEAGTQKLRDMINKGVTEDDLLNSARLAFRGGWNGVKLYFMIGLPHETMDDVEGIAALGKKVVEEYFRTPAEQRGKGLEVTISASSFVPKPFTPFQWEAQDSVDELRAKQRFLQERIRGKHLRFTWHDPELSFLEAVFARGDRRTGKALLRAWELGCRFDSWGEHFKYDVWMKAFDECGIDPAFYANRKRGGDEVFPWDHIDAGVSKKFLLSEAQKAQKGEVTPCCAASCSGCGAASFGCGICVDAKESGDAKRGAATGGRSGGADSGEAGSGEVGRGEAGSGEVSGGQTGIYMRIKFTRGVEVKFISHLDLMKVFERALRRSNLPVAYSHGFNPHPRMVFGLPLAVGVASRGEYADFELEREIEPDQFVSRLNDSLPDAVRVVKAGLKKSKANIMSSICAADYTLEIFLKEPMTPEDASEKLKMMLKMGSIMVVKENRNKYGDIVAGEIDIRPMILDAGLAAMTGMPPGYEGYGAAFTIHAKFSAGSRANLRPELFISALKEYGGIAVDSCRIYRENLYSEINGKPVDPLDQAVLSHK